MLKDYFHFMYLSILSECKALSICYECYLSVNHPNNGESQQGAGEDVLPVVVIVRGPAEGDAERDQEEHQGDQEPPAGGGPRAVECAEFTFHANIQV